MTTQATAVEAIQAALALLPANADSPWTNLDKMPYIHKTDDPKASPWSCAVVGRFDYLQTMQYMLACQPSNIRTVLASLAAKDAEIVMLREALSEISGACPAYRGLYTPDCNLSDFGGNADDYARELQAMTDAQIGAVARAALTQGAKA